MWRFEESKLTFNSSSSWEHEKKTTVEVKMQSINYYLHKTIDIQIIFIHPKGIS